MMWLLKKTETNVSLEDRNAILTDRHNFISPKLCGQTACMVAVLSRSQLSRIAVGTSCFH